MPRSAWCCPTSGTVCGACVASQSSGGRYGWRAECEAAVARVRHVVTGDLAAAGPRQPEGHACRRPEGVCRAGWAVRGRCKIMSSMQMQEWYGISAPELDATQLAAIVAENTRLAAAKQAQPSRPVGATCARESLIRAGCGARGGDGGVRRAGVLGDPAHCSGVGAGQHGRVAVPARRAHALLGAVRCAAAHSNRSSRAQRWRWSWRTACMPA